MTTQLQRWFVKLERQKHKLIADVGGWSVEQLRYRTEPTDWSILDVIDHLIRVETALLSAVRNNLPNASPISLRDRVGAWFIIGVMQSTMRVKVPASASMVLPGVNASASELTIRWSEVREEIPELLKSLQPEQLRLGVFRHPVSGWMTMPHALAFVSAHLQHHSYQVNRLKLSSSK